MTVFGYSSKPKRAPSPLTIKRTQAGEHIDAGWIIHLRNQPAEVLACAARAAEHWQNSTPRNKTIAIQLRGLGHQLNKDYPAAIAAYREVVEN